MNQNNSIVTSGPPQTCFGEYHAQKKNCARSLPNFIKNTGFINNNLTNLFNSLYYFTYPLNYFVHTVSRSVPQFKTRSTDQATFFVRDLLYSLAELLPEASFISQKLEFSWFMGCLLCSSFHARPGTVDVIKGIWPAQQYIIRRASKVK